MPRRPTRPRPSPGPTDASGAPRVGASVRRDRAHAPYRGDTRYFGTYLAAAAATPRDGDSRREPVAIGIVIDRSGSMGGRKVEVAKRAAIEVVDRLQDGDEVSLTIFDTEVDVLLPRTRIDDASRARFRALVAGVFARGGTALHEGWVRGCRAIAPEGGAPSGQVTRCFLLTDGQANAGVTDPREIARDVAAARVRFGVVTSTFGIGDYDEDVLAPMAAAGGGQFHDLRNPEEIVRTFLGELGEAVAVEASAVAIEVEHDARTTLDVISGLWAREGRRDPGAAAGGRQVTVLDVGDLIGGENRVVVVGASLPPGEAGAATVRVRATWRVPGSEETGASEWHEVAWAYGDDATCDGEAVEETLARDAGLHLMERYRRESAISSRDGQLARSRSIHASSLDVLSRMVASAPDLADRHASFDAEMVAMSARSLDAAGAKARVEASDRVRRGKRDLRDGPHAPSE